MTRLHPLLREVGTADAIPVHGVTPATLPLVLARFTAAERTQAEAVRFDARAGKASLLFAASGAVSAVLFGVEAEDALHRDPLHLGKLPGLVPPGVYRLAEGVPADETAALAFINAQYRFARYRNGVASEVALVAPPDMDVQAVTIAADAVTLARDLVNLPANALGPAEIEDAVRMAGRRFDASVSSVVGEALLAQGFPMIHAVGMGSPREPRLIDLVWGEATHPKVTLVGKGVAFDTGGLDIKPDAAMLLMKKDMGGAAAALACAQMIMASRLPVRLRLLVPAVENSVSGSSFRPGDVFPTRKGLTVEIGNTDAEGRLILADALALADEEAPDLLIDFATLTGAARVALGPDLPPIYSRDAATAAELVAHGARVGDPLWAMPLWSPYATGLESKIADLNNVATGGFAGSITAALFLERFVAAAKVYVHSDIYGWTPAEKPGRPFGGECQGARAVFELVKARYA